MAEKPVAQVRFYPVEAAIWRNLTKEGKAFYSATFSPHHNPFGSRRYDWQSVNCRLSTVNWRSGEAHCL